jgi:atrial natriuretic peptide receptor A
MHSHLVLDIIGFTSMAGEMSAYKVMEMLNDLYNEFDKLVEKHGVYKVETIGDAYMVVGGAPDVLPNPQLGAQRVALFSLDAMQKVNSFMTKDGERIFIRAGLHSGPVMAGVVGTAMPRYCFFGDTVNMSSRMESTSKKAKIQCSRTTRALLEQAPDYEFDLEQRREGDTVGVHVKGKGIVETWWIKGSTPLKQPRVAKPVDILGMEIGGDP